MVNKVEVEILVPSVVVTAELIVRELKTFGVVVPPNDWATAAAAPLNVTFEVPQLKVPLFVKLPVRVRDPAPGYVRIPLEAIVTLPPVPLFSVIEFTVASAGVRVTIPTETPSPMFRFPLMTRGEPPAGNTSLIEVAPV